MLYITNKVQKRGEKEIFKLAEKWDRFIRDMDTLNVLNGVA